jgi:hypothetical protein
MGYRRNQLLAEYKKNQRKCLIFLNFHLIFNGFSIQKSEEPLKFKVQSAFIFSIDSRVRIAIANRLSTQVKQTRQAPN